ncbi:hypothetical protein [Microbacterium candidum]|uniref:Uncharacterized protein n=1 Tax=Microbacterium candidum TaxID=3041922 RepID=A0ABT7N3A8_9MICO|nr:hypothetical protein [Microbacterium sp. ASV49]MDL9981190.1 hypothetical protein [Microbacterium sp. ASV49]
MRDAISKRTSLATMIGTAVPPALMREIAASILLYVGAQAHGGALVVPTNRVRVDA